MTTTPRTFMGPAIVHADDNSFYHVPTGAKAIGKYMYVYNTSTVPIHITIYIPKSGETSDASNEFFYGLIPSRQGKVISSFFNRQMEGGSSIRAFASEGAVLNITASGVEIY